MVLNILIFISAFIVLILSGSFTVNSLTRLSISLRFSFFVLGFILMATATTVPELLVGITSALDRAPSLSLGNVLGSNITNLGLILGLVALFKKKITVASKIIKDDVLYLALLILLSLFLLFDGNLTRLEGLILIGGFVVYLAKIISERKEFKAIAENGPLFKGCFLNFLIFTVSVILLILSAKYVVDYGILIAKNLNLPLILFGLSAVAFGTSLPELVFALKAAKADKEEMVLGDLIGACAINSSLILGVTALIYPISEIDFPSFFKAIFFLLLILLIFVLEMRIKGILSRLSAILLILLYFVFLFSELWHPFL